MASGTNPPFYTVAVISIVASTTSTSAAIPSGGETLIVTNPTTATAFVAVGSGSALTAVAGAFIPVLPNSRRIIAAPGATAVAVVLSGGTGTVFVEVGQGSAI
jgi:hypothetical protein